MSSGRSTRRPTIRDVSRLAGVSRMTVSRVLSDPDLVLPATRARVQKAIADLGYVLDRAAGGLASRRTGFIALIVPTLTNANFSTVAHGLTEVLSKAGFQLLISYTDYDLGEEETQIRNLLARRPEAMVLTGSAHTRAASSLLVRADIPVIAVADLPHRPIEHAVGFSNHQAGRMAAQYLLRKGFRRIGAVGGQSVGDVIDHRGEERMRGFEDELARAGVDSDLVLRQGAPPVSFAHGAAGLATLLALDPGLEAVFAVSDLAAVGVIMECQRRGIRVPQDLSVMGFGDFEIAREVVPALTTLHVDFRELGQRTGRLILDLLDGRHAGGPAVIDVGLDLLERGSVAAKGEGVRSLPA